ncbi:MAG TPA: CusA/CzcA family heavy metal efflux RND transporter [Burkholderiales bacterium]|nr:CusA/CzcA family heavy metal efflux RND transporter [Burkholderiales bacterium]
MLDRIITFALQQRVFVVAAALIVAIAGWRAWQDLPVEAFPDVQDVQVIIITQAPGKAPEEVERSITLPIELEMGGVPRMTQLRSVSITGLSVITLTFSDNTNDYFARAQVLERLQGVALPANVQPTLAPLTNAIGEIYRYVIEAPPGMPLYEVRAVQDWIIRPALRRVSGVADVVSFGGTIKEYQAKIDPSQLRKYGVTIDQVSVALGANSANTGGGLLARGEEALVIRSVGIFESIDDIARVVVASRGGRPIVVGDLGTVEVGSRVRTGIVAFNERAQVVQGVVQMIKGQDPAKVVDELKREVERVSGRLPPGVKIHPFYDRTELVKHTVHTVTENLAIGAALVVAVLIIFLRNGHAALAVAVVIPLSLLIAFSLMDAKGIAANLISLGAVDFGIIIDSAVVLVEALMVRLALTGHDDNPAHSGYGWRLHTLKAVTLEMGPPILFSKAIIILAFLPIFTFQRVEGKIFAPMAYTLSFALLGAIVLTLTLVPALVSFSLRYTDFAEKHSRWMHALQTRYRSFLQSTFPRRIAVTAASCVALAIALALAPRLGSEFLPKLDEGNIWLTITLPPSTNIDTTKAIEQHVRSILRGYPEVNSIVTQIGRPDDGTDPKGPNNVEIMADLKPRDTWRFARKDDMIADMTAKLKVIPGLPTNFSQVIEDNVNEALSGAKGEIVVKVFGPNLEILEQKSEQIARVLAGIRGAADVGASKVGGQSELTINLDRARMARYGINVADVNSTVEAALAGTIVNTFFEGDRRFNVTVRLAPEFRDAVDDVADLPVALPGGAGTIPLAAIADIAVKQGVGRVSREAGGRNVAVKANLLGRDQGSFVDEAMAKVDAQVKLPEGYYITWGGQFENQQRAIARLKIIVPLSVLGIFVLLFWAFRSMRQALLVVSMIPFTLIGGLAGLAVAGLHLSVSAAVGFIAVAGISVQNGVIMASQFNELIRNGRSVGVAVLEGAADRLRPILMTALMAGIGLMPAALSHGIGSETQRPFAVVIVGGIVSATLFTLVLLPLLYPLVAREEPSAVTEGDSVTA